MIDPQAAVFSRLTGDATLTAALAVYGGAPAVFEDGMAPGDLVIAAAPVVIVTPPTHLANADAFDASFRTEQIFVRLYARPAGSSLTLQTAAERVRTLLQNWGPAAITGGTLINGTVSGPSPAPTDDPSLDGRLILVNLFIRET